MEIKRIQSLLQREGLARPTHYYVQIVPPPALRSSGVVGSIIGGANTNTVGVLCERINIPGRIINTTPHMIYGVERKMPFGVQYQEIPATFICTDKFSVRHFFDEWHSAINNPFDNSFAYYNEYTTDMIIMKVDNQNSTVGVFYVEEVYPGIINPQQLAYGEKDYFKLDITFFYRRWATIADYRRNNKQPLTGIEIPALSGTFNPDVSFPPSPLNIEDIARSLLVLNPPVSLTFGEAKGIVANYNNFLETVLNKRVGGDIPSLDKLLGSVLI
jgi:hypothetical protein